MGLPLNVNCVRDAFDFDGFDNYMYLGVALTVPSLGLNSLNFHKVELSTTAVIPPSDIFAHIEQI